MFPGNPAIDSNGFIRTVLSTHDSQYHYHLTLLMQDYLKTGKKGYEMHEALNIFKTNPHMAGRIFSEMEIFISNPAEITNKNNWQDDFMQILKILVIYYSKADMEKYLTIQGMIENINQHEEELNIKLENQARVDNARIEQAIKQQISSLRVTNNLDIDLINKLASRVLPWELNPNYIMGPFRMGVEVIRTGFQSYDTKAKIPLFDQLYLKYPELMKAACNNVEARPADHIAKAKAVVWQQQLLQNDASLRIPRDVLNALINNPPKLHCDLNEDNTSAPGYQCHQSWRNERYVTIPLRKSLIEKYPELMNAAEQNKIPLPIVPVATRVEVPQIPILFRSPNVVTRATNVTTPAAQQIAEYRGIIDIIGTNTDLIDDIDLSETNLTCPLTLCLMRDPVILGTTGRVFERVAIANWLKEPGKSNINPLDNSYIDNTTLAPSYDKRFEIEKYLNSVEFKTIVINHNDSTSKSLHKRECTIN